MRKTKIYVTTALFILMAVPGMPQKIEPQQAEAGRQALVEWFECEECEEGQLERLVKQGQAVVPLLRGALLGGASRASNELQRRDLEVRYDELLKYSKTHPVAKLGSSKESFVSSNLARLNAQYQVRAAQALGAIGGASSKRALEEGMKKVTRADVRNTIKASLAKLQ
jgi:hypothetical protein